MDHRVEGYASCGTQRTNDKGRDVAGASRVGTVEKRSWVTRLCVIGRKQPEAECGADAEPNQRTVCEGVMRAIDLDDLREWDTTRGALSGAPRSSRRVRFSR
jgi:hypothetical protein